MYIQPNSMHLVISVFKIENGCRTIGAVFEARAMARKKCHKSASSNASETTPLSGAVATRRPAVSIAGMLKINFEQTAEISIYVSAPIFTISKGVV